jgi:selenocysteine-specific elongation factor
VGDTLEVLPGGKGVRVRSVEVHGRKVERATPGQRVAAAVAVERRRPLAPGDALVRPGSYAATYRLDIRLEAGDRIAGPSLTVCHGTSAVAARIVRSGSRHAQLRLSRPLVAARGDRVVLRQEATVGGGVVLDPAPPRRLDERRLELLDGDDLRSALAALVDEPVEYESVRIRLGIGDSDLSEAFDGFERIGPWICSADWLETRARSVDEALRAREAELDPGLSSNAVLGSAPWAGAVADRLGLESRNGKLYLPGRGPVTGGPGAELEQQVVASGLQPLVVADSDLALRLEREGRIVRLGDGLAIGPEAYAAYQAVLLEEFEHAGTVSLAGFRDRAGVSRRVAQLVLERFDADRLTLRVGDERRLRRSALAG